MTDLSAAALFRVIQASLLPLGVAGYVPFVTRLIAHSRLTGTNATVLASLYTRYMQHKLGTRPDSACERLMEVMPSVSPAGLQLTTAPTRIAHRLTGHVPRIYQYRYPGEPPMFHQSSARTTFYDVAIEQRLPRIAQLVILGAGFDTRAYTLPLSAKVRCFEVDEPKTQAFKREMLQKAGVDARSVTFVPADFEREDWLEKLLAAGFSLSEPSFFVWESVSMYLDAAAVEGTLRKVARTAAGSGIAFDYFSREILDSRSPFMRYARAMIKLTGEPWKFGIDNTPPVRDRVAAFLRANGLELEEQRNFGPESGGRRALAGFAIANVPVAA